MDWKTSLDRYLTTPPDNHNFEKWADDMWEEIPESDISSDEYEKHENVFQEWDVKLYDKNYSPQDAAKIFIRAYYLYLVKPE